MRGFKLIYFKLLFKIIFLNASHKFCNGHLINFYHSIYSNSRNMQNLCLSFYCNIYRLCSCPMFPPLAPSINFLVFYWEENERAVFHSNFENHLFLQKYLLLKMQPVTTYLQYLNPHSFYPITRKNHAN